MILKLLKDRVADFDLVKICRLCEKYYLMKKIVHMVEAD